MGRRAAQLDLSDHGLATRRVRRRSLYPPAHRRGAVRSAVPDRRSLRRGEWPATGRDPGSGSCPRRSPGASVDPGGAVMVNEHVTPKSRSDPAFARFGVVKRFPGASVLILLLALADRLWHLQF